MRGTPLQLLNAVRTQTCPLGELLLRQACYLPMVAEQITKD